MGYKLSDLILLVLVRITGARLSTLWAWRCAQVRRLRIVRGWWPF